MKTVPVNLQTHVAGVCTTLATCWKITARDGTQKFFTSHSRDLLISGDVYDADLGYTPSQITTTLTLAVDNLDVQGFVNVNGFSTPDLLAGKWDFADVEIFQVNYLAPTDGVIHLRKGWVGQVEFTKNGFGAEIRGITDRLRQKIIEVTSPICRADLGDTRCKVRLDPPNWQATTAHTVREAFQAETGSVVKAPAHINALLYSEDFSNAVWSEVDGGSVFNDALDPFGVTTTADKLVETTDFNNFFVQGPDLATAVGQQVTYSIWVKTTGSNEGDGTASLRISRDGTAPGAGAAESSSQLLNLGSGWQQFVLTHTSVNAQGGWNCSIQKRSGGAEEIHVWGAQLERGGAFTTYEMRLGGPIESQAQNRHFKCVVAGTSGTDEPAWNDTIGGQTVDGTVTWEAIQALTQTGTVTTTGTDKEFTDSTRIEADNFWANGEIEWTSGLNSGLKMEVKISTDAGVITLVQDMPFTVNMGDAYTIKAGCFKALIADCRTKFDNTVNFRGEPYIPQRTEVSRASEAGIPTTSLFA